MKMDKPMYVWILIAVCLTSRVFVHSTELRLIPDKDVLYLEKGINATVMCEVNDLNSKTVQWNHKGKQIAIVAPENTVVFVDPVDRLKYIISGAGKTGGNFSFTVLNFTSEDVGEVTCDVSQVNPISIYLELFVPPEEIYFTVHSPLPYRILEWGRTNKRLLVPMDSEVILSCSVTKTHPEPVVRWLLNDTFSPFVNITEKSYFEEEMYSVTSTLSISLNISKYSDVITDDRYVSATIEMPDAYSEGMTTSVATIVRNSTSEREEKENEIIDTISEFDGYEVSAKCFVRVGDREYEYAITIEYSSTFTSGTRSSISSGISIAISVLSIWLLA